MSNPHAPSRWHRWLVTFSPAATSVMLLLALVGGYLGTGVQLKLSLTDLLPENHPAVMKFNKLTEVVGGVGFFSVILHAEDGESHLKAAPALVAELKKSSMVRDAFYAREQRFFTDRLLYYVPLKDLADLEKNIDRQIRSARESVIDLGLWGEEETKEGDSEVFNKDLKEKAKKSANTSPYLTSKDGKHLLLMVKPTFDSTDLEKSEALIAESDAILKRTLPPGVKYDYAERYYRKVVETKLVQKDIVLLGALSILSILLILFLYLKSVKALVVIFLPVFMAMGITMGITRLAIGHINIITGFLLGILSGLGVDYGIHLYLRLGLEKREPSSGHPDPVWRSLHTTGHSIFVGAAAAAFSFFLLSFSTFRAFSEFGIVCGTGIMAVFFCLMLSFSTLTRLLGLHKGHVEEIKNERVGRFPVLSLPRGFTLALASSAVLFVVGLFVRFEYDFERMMQHSVTMEELQNLVDDIYQRAASPSAFAAKDKETAIAVEKMLEEKYVPSVVSEVISGATIIPEDQDKKAVILGRMKASLSKIKDRWIQKTLDVPASAVRAWVEAKPFTFTDLPFHLQDALRGTQKSGYLLYLYPAVDLGNAHGVHTYADMVRDFESRFPDLLTGSDAVVFSDILHLIRVDGSIVLAVILVSLALFIWVNVRRIDDSLTSYLPLLLAFPLGMGLMVLFDVKFNIFNISIIPSFVAIGIDVPIHLVHRAREVRSGYKAVRDLAGSINLALITQAVGFGVLIFAKAGVLRSLGWLALLGSIAIWWVGLFLLPAFLEIMMRREARRHASAVTVSAPEGT
jgi:uncharacterized protein